MIPVFVYFKKQVINLVLKLSLQRQEFQNTIDMRKYLFASAYSWEYGSFKTTRHFRGLKVKIQYRVSHFQICCLCHSCAATMRDNLK